MKNRSRTNLLIADCGGTSVDWCFIDNSGNEEYFSTESYHPSYWNEELYGRARKFWSLKSDMSDAQVYFFSAGCYQKDRRKDAHDFLNSVGFRNVTVLSDLHAAGIASYGSGEGWVAILGTGSVLFKWSEMDVRDLIGGKGHLEGDEGSGFYFGKLIIRAFQKKELTPLQEKILREKLLLNQIDVETINLEDKHTVSSLSKILTGAINFNEFHQKNFQRFIETHCKYPGVKSIKIVGSYGAANSVIATETFNNSNIRIEAIIRRPISKLVEQNDVYIE